MDIDQIPKRHEVIIVGAGPSGCTCAIFLARAGKRVLLLDKKSFPREKVCGDAVSGKSLTVLNKLGLLEKVQEQVHGTVYNVKLVAPNGSEVTVPFEPAEGLDCAGYVLKRQVTDNILAEAAKLEENITFVENFTVNSLTKDQWGNVNGVMGKIGASQIDNAPGAQQTQNLVRFDSKVVVGADGSGSVVARNVGLKSVPPEHLYMGIRTYYSGVADLKDEIELFFIDEVLPGYLWIFPIGNGEANVGLGILASDLKKKGVHTNKILENAIKNSPKLKDRFANATTDGKVGAWTIPLGSHKRLNYGDGWVLIGDAASLVDPFSGEGFGNAASSGMFAAKCINEALDASSGDVALLKEQLKSYSDDVDKLLRPEMETTYRLQRATRMKFFLNRFISKAEKDEDFRQVVISMLASNEEKKQVQNPLFFLKLLLP